MSAIYNIFSPKPVQTVEAFANRITDLLFPSEWLSSFCLIDTNYKTNLHYAQDFIFSRFSHTGLQSPTGKSRQQVACLTHYMDSRLHHLKAFGYPILVLTGDSDTVLRQPSSSEYLAKSLNARLEIYPLGGHALRMQDPEWHDNHLLSNLKQGIKYQNSLKKKRKVVRKRKSYKK